MPIKVIRQPEVKQKTERIPNHFCFAVDVSGSMYGELDTLKSDLKNKLRTSLNPEDFITIIYYSSNGLCGKILDMYKIENAADLTATDNAIDRWLQPMALTGFVEPLNLCYESVRAAWVRNIPTTLIFMSDGHENQNSKDDVINWCKRIAPNIQSAFVVEYGDYANHNLLEEMAEALFGQLITASTQKHYDTLVDSVLKTKSKIQLEINPQPEDLVYWVLLPNNIVQSWRATPFKMQINVDPEDTVYTYQIAGDNSGDIEFDIIVLLQACIALFQQGFTGGIELLLGVIGDRDLIDLYAAAIGKQRRNRFVEKLHEYLNDTSLLYNKTRVNNYVVNPAEPDLFDLFEVLSAESGNQLLIRHPLFKYKRGGAKVVTLEEGDREVNFKEHSGQSLDFSSIVFNTSRANIGFNGKLTGDVYVDKHPDNPDRNKIYVIPTHIYRTYSIVRDGIVTMDKIPVRLTEGTKNGLNMLQFPIEYDVEPGIHLIDLSKIPVANKNRVTEGSDGSLFVEDYFAMTVLKAYQKVFRYYEAQLELKKPSANWLDKYGETGVKFLNSIGLNENNGFSPVNTTASFGGDFYYAPSIDLKIKGYNSLPSVTDILDRISKNKKLIGAPALMAQAIDLYKEIVIRPESSVHIREAVKQIVKLKRNAELNVASSVFSNLLSRKAYSHFNSEGVFIAEMDFNAKLELFGINYIIIAKDAAVEFTLVEEENEIAI